MQRISGTLTDLVVQLQAFLGYPMNGWAFWGGKKGGENPPSHLEKSCKCLTGHEKEEGEEQQQEE